MSVPNRWQVIFRKLLTPKNNGELVIDGNSISLIKNHQKCTFFSTNINKIYAIKQNNITYDEVCIYFIDSNDNCISFSELDYDFAEIESYIKNYFEVSDERWRAILEVGNPGGTIVIYQTP